MKEWVELYTFCKTCAPTLTVKRISSGIQNSLQIFSSVAIEWMSLEIHECIPRAGADKHPIPDKWIWRDDLLN